MPACGGGPSEEDVRRSQAEYDLANGLLGEQNLAGAFQHLGEAVRLDPDNAEAHYLLGNLHLASGAYDRAEHHLREAMRANEALEGAGRPSLVADAHNSLGVVYLHTQRYDDAVTELTASSGDLMNRAPHLAWGNLGWAYLEQHQLDEAQRSLEQAVGHQPLFCVGWYRLGQVHVARGDEPSLARADEALTHALDIDDEACRRLQEAWRLRGETRARLGRHEDAVADLEHCVELAADTDAGRACARLLETSP